MTNDDATSEPSSVIHRRLSVTHAGPARRSDLVRHLILQGPGPLIDLTAPRARQVTGASLRDAATGVVAGQAEKRRAALERIESDLEAALVDHDRVTAERDATASRLDRLREGVEWLADLRTSVPELYRSAEGRARELDARRLEHREARARLDRVLEQRAEVAAATQLALRELEALDGAHLDESGLRREVEAATSEVQAAAAAHLAAHERLRALEEQQAELEDQLEALGAERSELEIRLVEAPVDPRGVRAALLAVDDAATFAHLDGRAEELASALGSVDREIAGIAAEVPVGPEPAEVDAAREAMRAARAELARAEAAARDATLTGPQRAELDAAHESVLDAEEARGGRGRGSARQRVEEARAAEVALLDHHGFATYLEVVLCGGRQPGASAARALAERQAVLATERFEVLSEAAAVTPEVAGLLAERDRLLGEASDLLRVDPGDRAVELLAGLRAVPRDLLEALAGELLAVGVRPVGVRLADAARAWLAEQERSSDLHETRRGRIADLDERRRQFAARLTAADSELATGADQLRRASDLEAGARRAVSALEAEMTARAGEDARRIERVAAAEQLRAQVAAVERTLTVGEDEARAAMEAAAGLESAAEAALDRAEAALADVARRARRWTDVVETELADQLRADPLADLDRLVEGLEEAVAEEAVVLADGEAEVTAAAGAASTASSAAADLRTRLDGDPTADDVVEALSALVRDPARGPVAVLDDPFAGFEPALRDSLLDVVVEASQHRPVVLLTDDAATLGWAIGLPPEVGGVVPADALASDAGDPGLDEDAAHRPAHATGRSDRSDR